MFCRAPKGARLLSSQSLAGCIETPFLTLTSHQHAIITTRPKTTVARKKLRAAQQKEKKDAKKAASKKVPLDVNFLGKPGNIVVLPQPPKPRPPPEFVQVQEQPEEVTRGREETPFMVGELEKQEKVVDARFVNERIEEFRRPYGAGDLLDGVDFERLKGSVGGSFTTYQLSDYIADHNMEGSEEKGARGEGDGEEGVQERKVKFSKWKPGTSEFLELGRGGKEASIAKRIAATRQLKGKDLLAEMVIRDCWRIGVVGEVGQLDITLPQGMLVLFIKSEDIGLRHLATLYDARVDIMNSLGLVRITGKQRACESIRDVITDATMRIREEELDMYPLVDGKPEASKAFTKKFLDLISFTYGVAFENVSIRGPQKMLYLAENREGMEQARRTLNFAVHEVSAEPVDFATYLGAEQPANTYPFDPESYASWFDRQNKWFRWGASSDSLEPVPTPLFDQHQTELSSEILKFLRKRYKDDVKLDKRLESRVDLFESITAAVGKGLFRQRPTSKKKIVNANELGKKNYFQRTFIPSVPNVHSFLRPLGLDQENQPQRLYRLQLVPSALHTNIFPPLDIEISLNDKQDSAEPSKEVIIQSAKATMNQRVIDYLLPENSLDLRFTRCLHIDLLNEVWQTIPEHLQQTLTSVFTRERTHPDANIPLPPFIHLTFPEEILLKVQKRIPEGVIKDGVATGEYMFIPITDRRGTLLNQFGFHGQKLRYGYYESAPALGSPVTDLFLERDFDIASSEAGKAALEMEQMEEFKFFYGNACRLAFELDRAGRIG